MKKHLYINGDWKSVNTYKPLYAPYSEETLAEIAQGTEEDVKRIVTAAKNAMKEMNTLSAYDRATILEKVAHKKWMKEEKNLQKLLQKKLQNQYVLQGGSRSYRSDIQICS